MPSSTERQSTITKYTIDKVILPDLIPKVGDEKTTTTANSGEGNSILPTYPYESRSGSEVKASDPEHMKMVAAAVAVTLAMARASAEAKAKAQDRRSLEEKIKTMARFGPIYGDDTESNRMAKDSAWKHMIEQSMAQGIDDPEKRYMSSMNKIQRAVAECYGKNIGEKQAQAKGFRTLMAKDSCFFLQLALHILGGKDILGYNRNHLYFGKDSDPTSRIPDMFFVGNQIPRIVIEASMEQPFFQNMIRKGTGMWKRPDHDLEKLALYLMVVEPHLVERKRLKLNNCLPPWLIYYLPYIKLPPPNFRADPPYDVLHALHRLLLGHRPEKDATYSEMKEFRDLEAGDDGKELKIHSAGELKKKGIKLVKGELGITNIRFKDRGYSAYLYVPPFTVNTHTEQLLTSLAKHELTLTDSQREATAYFRFIRDLACNYKDFKILEKKGIIIVEDKNLKSNMVHMLDTIVSRHNSNYTLNFRQIRRRIEDYGGPPWRLISVCLGLLAVVQTIFTVLSYVIPR